MVEDALKGLIDSLAGLLGRDFYHAVAADQEMGVPDAECEEMGYFFARRYRERFGDFPETGSGISCESCSNRAGRAG